MNIIIVRVTWPAIYRHSKTIILCILKNNIKSPVFILHYGAYDDKFSPTLRPYRIIRMMCTNIITLALNSFLKVV